MRSRIGVFVVLLVAGASMIGRSQGPSIEGAWRVTEVVVTGANASTNRLRNPGCISSRKSITASSRFAVPQRGRISRLRRMRPS